MEQTNQNHILGEEKISKLLVKFSIPCILSLLISALYNIVDQIFVGNSELGYLGNAATGIVFPILIIAQAFAWCIGDGCAAYLSICQGKKRHPKCTSMYWNRNHSYADTQCHYAGTMRNVEGTPAAAVRCF